MYNFEKFFFVFSFNNFLKIEFFECSMFFPIIKNRWFHKKRWISFLCNFFRFLENRYFLSIEKLNFHIFHSFVMENIFKILVTVLCPPRQMENEINTRKIINARVSRGFHCSLEQERVCEISENLILQRAQRKEKPAGFFAPDVRFFVFGVPSAWTAVSRVLNNNAENKKIYLDVDFFFNLDFGFNFFFFFIKIVSYREISFR